MRTVVTLVAPKYHARIQKSLPTLPHVVTVSPLALRLLSSWKTLDLGGGGGIEGAPQNGFFCTTPCFLAIAEIEKQNV